MEEITVTTGGQQRGDQAAATPFGVNGSADGASASRQSAGVSNQTGTARVKRGMAEMLKGGVIMDVVTPEQAKIAEGAGAVAVMALERVPADIRAQGGCRG